MGLESRRGRDEFQGPQAANTPCDVIGWHTPFVQVKLA
jgi:hypothetical protein